MQKVANESEISWTDSTWNPWIGCTKVGPGCDGCYAERDNALRKWVPGWGVGQPRHRTKTWGDPLKWNDAAPFFFQVHKRRQRVFTASLADFLDNEVPDEWHADAWAVVRQCTDLELYIVTKRISNFEKMKPADWCEALYRHVVLIITVVNQDEADRDVPRLLAIKARYPWLRVGLSIEPMLGPIDLDAIYLRIEGHAQWLDWVIGGGESGSDKETLRTRPVAPTHPGWLRLLRDQCAAAGVPFHLKQWGEYGPVEHHHPGAELVGYDPEIAEHDCAFNTATAEFMARVGKRKAGRLLDGVAHDGFPAAETIRL